MYLPLAVHNSIFFFPVLLVFIIEDLIWTWLGQFSGWHDLAEWSWGDVCFWHPTKPTFFFFLFFMPLENKLTQTTIYSACQVFAYCLPTVLFLQMFVFRHSLNCLLPILFSLTWLHFVYIFAEMSRKQRQIRLRRKKWIWSCIGLSVAIGASVLACSYLPVPGEQPVTSNDGSNTS